MKHKQLGATDMGFLGLLTITLIALKISGAVAISWFWVFAPIFFWFVVVFILFGLMFAVTLFELLAKDK